MGALLGILWCIALRVMLIDTKSVHYHANFNLVIEGAKDPFDSFTQYEEVQACSGNEVDNPRGRAHLHKPYAHAVHVHDDAVTWSAFFANVGYGLTDKAITTQKGTFVDGQDGNKLQFILNGQKVTTITNRVVASTDALLVTYGKDTDEIVKKQFDDIPKDAAKLNTEYDPASCSGTKELSFIDKLLLAINPTK